MSIRLGANPIGFEGMELGHKFPRDAVELAATLERLGLACVSGWYSAQLLARDARAELSRLRPHLDLLKAVGSPVLVFADVSGAIHGNFQRPLSERPRLKASEWREFGRRLTKVAAVTAAEGVRLAYHHHMGTVAQCQEDIDSLMDATGAEVGLLLDTGHATFAGVFTVPGDGSIDFARVFHELRDYSGWVILEAEQDPRIADPMTYASLGYNNLRRLLSENAR